MISSKIRYKFINRIVNDIYIQQNICSFPINVIEIINSIKNRNIIILSYSKFMKHYGLTKDVTLEILTSDDGCCDNIGNKYVIYYNDLIDLPQERINWTIAHELGHILCNHYSDKTKIYNSNLSEIEYKFLEKEANYFASVLLSHSAILSQLNIHNAYEIQFFCNLSKQASQYRYKNYLQTKQNISFTSSDRYIIRNFKNYIDEKNNDYEEHLNFMSSFRR